MGKRVAFTGEAKAELRAIPQPVCAADSGDLARFLQSGKGNVIRLRDVEPPLHRLRAQDHRVFFRDHGDYIEVTSIRDRKQAYR